MGMTALVCSTLAARVAHREEHTCGSCAEPVPPYNPLALVQFVTLTDTAGQVTLTPLLDEDGQYRYWPYWFHGACWEEVQDLLQELSTDTPPRLLHAAATCSTCLTCGAHMQYRENVGVVQWGVLTLSDRVPSGEWALEMAIDAGPPALICASCMSTVSLNILEGLWGEGHLDDGLGVT